MYEQVCYRKSFLKEVVARIDFASPVGQIEKGVPNKLVNTIVNNFPIVEPAEIIMQEFALEGNSVKQGQATRSPQWNYYSKDRERQLTLSPQAVFVSYKRYNHYEEIKEQFGTVIDAINKNFPDTKASRFGLRYINQIDVQLDDPTQWDAYINPQLLGSRTFFGEEDALSRLITIAETKYNDIALRFQYGMPNPDYPAPVKRPLFVLDLDASVSQAHDLNEAMAYMDEAHGRIQSAFERSITGALREKMNVRPVQQ